MIIDRITTVALGSIFLFAPACDDRNTKSETNEITYTLDKREPSAMFWDYAASTSMLQTELAQLAAEKSINPGVRTFADSALLIHSKALRRLRNIAGKYKHMQLPDSLTGSDKAMIEEFKELQGEDFDSRYLEYLTLTHKAQLNRYQETLSETEDPALRLWLNNMKTRLNRQLQFYATTDSVAAK